MSSLVLRTLCSLVVVKFFHYFLILSVLLVVLVLQPCNLSLIVRSTTPLDSPTGTAAHVFIDVAAVFVDVVDAAVTTATPVEAALAAA